VTAVACDESGYEGQKLIGTTTDVFAHASVSLDVPSAGDCMSELRDRIRSPATEYKAGHLLREKHQAVLRWLLGSSGPLLGNAHVYLVDKEFFVVDRVVDALLDDAAAAVTLYRDGRRAIGPGRWDAFLVAANDLLRTRPRDGVIDSFFGVVGALRGAGGPGPLREILERLGRAGPRAVAYRARLSVGAIPPPDLLIPAIVRVVAHWTGPVAIVHDQQNTLSAARIAQLKELIGSRLDSLRLVDSAGDPRVQVADIVAGVARKIASDELNGRGDPVLTGLLRPYVDTSSVLMCAPSRGLPEPS
jgi:hypothetical protein